MQLLKGSKSKGKLPEGWQMASRREPVSHYLYRQMGSKALPLILQHDPEGLHFIMVNKKQVSLLDLVVDGQDFESIKWILSNVPRARCAWSAERLLAARTPIKILELILTDSWCGPGRGCYFKMNLLRKVVEVMASAKDHGASEEVTYCWQLLQLAQKHYEYFGGQLFDLIPPWAFDHGQKILVAPILKRGPEWMVLDLLRLFQPNLQGCQSAHLLQALLLKCPSLRSLEWFCQHIGPTVPLAQRTFTLGAKKYRHWNDAKLWIVKRWLPEHFAADMLQNLSGHPSPRRGLLLLRLHFGSLLQPGHSCRQWSYTDPALNGNRDTLMKREQQTVASCAPDTFLWEMALAYNAAAHLIPDCQLGVQRLLEENCKKRDRGCTEVLRDEKIMQRVKAYQQAEAEEKATPSRPIHMPLRVLRARREMGMHHEFCAALVLYADGLLKLRDDLPLIMQLGQQVHRAWRFIQIATRLPLMLQQVLCNRLYYVSKDHMTSNEMERAMAYVGLFLFDEHKRHTYLLCWFLLGSYIISFLFSRSSEHIFRG